VSETARKPDPDELRGLRNLREAAEEVARHSTMYFVPSRTPSTATHLGHHVDVPVQQWDALMDALGWLDGLDADAAQAKRQVRTPPG
jgi:hypothetical protein